MHLYWPENYQVRNSLMKRQQVLRINIKTTFHVLRYDFPLKCDPPSSKSCCLIYKIRGLPLTLMIHFVNVQTSKLEQHMQFV